MSKNDKELHSSEGLSSFRYQRIEYYLFAFLFHGKYMFLNEDFIMVEFNSDITIIRTYTNWHERSAYNNRIFA